MTQFEFDLNKSQSNFEKHGIDFQEAQRIWHDPRLIEVKAISNDEPRFLVIGKIDLKHWSAVITYRNGIVRLISVRRSRDLEVKLYES